MKKNQKNSTGIMLVAVQTEKNQKQKRIENFIDGLLVWIFAMLTGIAVCNMFGIKVNALPAIAGIVFAVYLSFEAEWKGKLKKYALLAEVLVLILVLLLFHKTILDGWYQMEICQTSGNFRLRWRYWLWLSKRQVPYLSRWKTGG